MPAAGMPPPRLSPHPSEWQALRLLSFYRVIIAGLLAVLYFGLADSNPFNVRQPALFTATLLVYLAFSLGAGLSTRLRWPGYAFQALVQVLADIAALALLMHASGGAASSLAILLVIAVVVGALLLPGRTAYLFAAVATLIILFETTMAGISAEGADAGHITRAGLLGVVLFTAAGLAHIVSLRARESAALAEQRGIDLANLEQLNRYIVQQLQSGLLVVDAGGSVRLANDTARQLLAIGENRSPRLDRLAVELADQLLRWRNDRHWQPQPVAVAGGGARVVPRFSELSTSSGKGALILLDDSTRLAQQAQQLKLASLGRLTASIAHEIRNPLGAISHAAQLLQESEPLNDADRRLSEIICNHTRRVNEIIENVLQLSRRSNSQPQKVPMRQWMHAFREDFALSEKIQAEQLLLDIDPENLEVHVDPGHLHQVLTNLCENAFRHGRGAECQVRLRVRHNANGACLEISDNGPGIDPETAEQMFEPFYTTAASGTGLGLYIARELCEINQARLSYQAGDDGRACFRIQFT